MPRFGVKSMTELDSCNVLLRDLFFEVIEYFDCSILEGRRGRERQTMMFEADPPQSHLAWPDSKHNCPDDELSDALDAAPWPIDWEDTDRFYALGGFVKGVASSLDIPIRWGGDWDGDWSFKDQGFHDLGHFELED